MYLDLNKPQLIILSGLPGSGKSSIAKDILYDCHMRDISCYIYSYDKYHLDNEGKFEYDKDGAKDYILNCFDDFDYHCQIDNYKIMILDNVNSVYDEFKKYVESYDDFKAEFSPVIINFIRVNSDIQTAYKNCTHKVPMCVIDKISKRMESIEEINKQTNLIDSFQSVNKFRKF